MFVRELRRIERVPQRALYRQTRQMITSAERKAMRPQASQKDLKLQKIAREVIWFFASLVLALLFGLIVFYLLGEFLPDTFISLVDDLGSINMLYYIISLSGFAGIYVARIIVWAVKKVTLK